ncbi:MAG: hypothetical protein H6742_18385 [Alphaproteobacteria bacterium]|nr:hypothetical protein [Alphaproteobacteria bacterium]
MPELSALLDSHRSRLVSLLSSVPVREPPPPWRRTTFLAVGGLTEVGFGRQSDLLLIVSSAGRGLVDCASGELVGRDRQEPDDGWYDAAELLASGIDRLEDELVPIAGLHGGGLALTTDDGWAVTVAYPNWPEAWVVLQAGFTHIYMEPTQPGRHLPSCSRIFQQEEVRAAGFSPTGRSLVVATSSDVTAFHRD